MTLEGLLYVLMLAIGGYIGARVGIYWKAVSVKKSKIYNHEDGIKCRP